MPSDTFFSITMATIWFINMCSAVLQASLFGLVGLLPPVFSTLFMSGQGLAGMFAAVAMLLSILSNADESSAALGYFITPCVATLGALLCYLLLPHLVRTGRRQDAAGHTEGVGGHPADLRPSPSSLQEFARFYMNRSSSGDEEKLQELLGHSDVLTGDKEAEVQFTNVANETRRRSSIPAVFRKIWLMALCVTSVFGVTLSVFPVVTVRVETVYRDNPAWGESSQPRRALDLSDNPDARSPSRFLTFAPSSRESVHLCLLLHCLQRHGLRRPQRPVARPLGESAAFRQDFLAVSDRALMLLQPSKDSKLFPVAVFSRLAFVPLLMLCNVKNTRLTVLFRHDLAFIAIMALFSFSNGYLATLCMAYAPQLVTFKDRETAGSLMTFFLVSGLALGASFSFLLGKLV
ncbi:equilibrative nucleoside transporter 2-like isoform X2 [Antennarius striatus]